MVVHGTPVSYRTMLDKVKIDIIGLHKSLGGRKILDGIDLKIKDGETMCVIGGSGAGKSVTIKHIVGLMKPDEGDVRVDGNSVVNATFQQVQNIRKKIGYLFQGAALLNSLNVYENVALPLREHETLKEPEIHDRVMDKLELVHLMDAEKKFPAELSGGMKKRAGLARAIIREPEILLYDEPTAGLDPVIATTINELILEMQERLKVTSILVTHDMSSCFKVANRMAMLLDGKIYKVGAPRELRALNDPILDQFIFGDSEGPLRRETKKR